MKDRRSFLKSAALLTASPWLIPDILQAMPGKKVRPNILLVSGWQIENIGDVAHTPGICSLFEKYLPEANIFFWPSYEFLPDEEAAMIQRRFPKVRIVKGALNADGTATTPELSAAIKSSDFLLHNSGPFMVQWSAVSKYHLTTGKPFGVYGITYGYALFGKNEREILSRASFAYFRDSVSLNQALADGIHAKVMGFSPDVAFAFDVTNKERTIAFLKTHSLTRNGYVCCIPKQRYTPSWEHPLKHRHYDREKDVRNIAMAASDHAPMLEFITKTIEQTNLMVVVCHEDITEIPIGKSWIVDKLPPSVAERVVHHSEVWLPDEALGIYKASVGLISYEMHSPILCIGNGIPAIVCRWYEQSSKGLMWKDIGLTDWLFDFDKQDERARMTEAALTLVKNPQASKLIAVQAQQRVNNLFDKTFKTVVENARHNR